METIGPAERFYGYIIGLQIERSPDDAIGRRLYATFEYNGEVTVWRVPDPDLFQILSRHLCSMAESRTSGDDYGYDKLWIKHDAGKWDVSLP